MGKDFMRDPCFRKQSGMASDLGWAGFRDADLLMASDALYCGRVDVASLVARELYDKERRQIQWEGIS